MRPPENADERRLHGKVGFSHPAQATRPCPNRLILETLIQRSKESGEARKMSDGIKSQNSLRDLVREERKPILLGLACGTAMSATFPLIESAIESGNRWIRDRHHIDSSALPATMISIAALALFVWPGPILLQWAKSYGRGVNRGSFAVPALATFFALGLRYRLPLPWWEVSIAVIGICAFLILYLPYRLSRALEFADDRSDDPRTSLKDAWPERRSLAQEIARHILREGKATYAVYGGFGTGKSSMLNFISEALRGDHGPQAIVVRFSGWLPGSRENLADQLLSDIATECSREYWSPQFRRTALRIAKTVKTAIPHGEWIAEWIPQETQQDAIDDLHKSLERLPCRVVVLVDEMDRMQKDELFVLLKLIRGFTSLPRLSFVCALERSHVEEIICKEYGTVDHSFYHKFFIESFELPKLTDSFLEAETHDALIALFDEQGWFRRDEQAKREYSNAIREHWESIFAPLCTNLRGVMRLAGSVRAQSWPLVDEVNPLDLTLLAALRYFAPTASDLIWLFRNTLCAPDINSGITDADIVYEGQISTYFEQENKLLRNPLLQEQARRIRKVLFSGLDEIKDASGTDSNRKVTAAVRYFERNNAGARTKKLRSASYFPAYFQNALPGTIFPEKELAETLDKLSRSDDDQTQHAIFMRLKEMEGNGEKRLNFIEKLTDRAVQSLSLDKCSLVANVLVGRSSGLDDPHSEREYSQIARFVISVCDALFLAQRAGDRLQLLNKCILGARADGVVFRVLLWAVSRPFPDAAIAAQREIENVPKEQLEQAYLKRMETQYGPEKGIKDVDLNLSYWFAFSEWGIILEKSVWARDRNLQREFWKRYIDSPQRIADFARFVLAPFALQPNTGAPTSSLWKNILPEEELLILARTYPPYQDLSAISYLTEILGEGVIPEPIRMGSAMPNSIEQAGFTDE